MAAEIERHPGRFVLGVGISQEGQRRLAGETHEEPLTQSVSSQAGTALLAPRS